ncbi:hypothetical protein OH76DRAFT_1396813, partial [Lentinus brumalis]
MVNIFESMGCRATAIPSAEEDSRRRKDFPFLVESRIQELVGEHSCSAHGEASVVVNGNAMTGASGNSTRRKKPSRRMWSRADYSKS